MFVTKQLERLSNQKVGTALHAGKDFAVSPEALPPLLTLLGRVSMYLRTPTSLLAPLTLLWTGVTRYHSPVQRLGVFGLSSHQFLMSDYRARVVCNKKIIFTSILEA